jgi:hypothetical protein
LWAYHQPMDSPLPPFLSREWDWELSLLPPSQRRTGMNSNVAAVSKVGMGKLVATFSEAHRYELNVSAVSKAEMGLGAQLVYAV